MTGRLTLKLEKLSELQYIPRNMPTVFALLCFVVVIHWLIFPYPPGLLRWHCGNLTIAPVPAKQPWWIWINTSCEIIMNDYITTTKQSTTKPCAYLLGYTVSGLLHTFRQRKRASRSQLESLAGKFYGASHVVPWGRTHLRSIYVLISSLKSPTHKCRLSGLTWRHYWLNNGENWWHIWPPTTAPNVTANACTDGGGGLCCGNPLYAHWAHDLPRLAPHHINTNTLTVLCSLWWVQIVGYVSACRSYSFVCTLHHLIIIIVQTLSEGIELIKCLSDVICRVCE